MENKYLNIKKTLTNVKLAIAEMCLIDEQGNEGCCYGCFYQDALRDIIKKIEDTERNNNK